MTESVSKLDLIFSKEPKEIQQKLVKLLLNYNAQLRYNKEEDQFQVDLLLPFDHPTRKQQFVQGFLRSRIAQTQNNIPTIESPSLITTQQKIIKKQPLINEPMVNPPPPPAPISPAPEIIKAQQKQKIFQEVKTYNEKKKNGFDYQKLRNIIQSKLNQVLKPQNHQAMQEINHPQTHKQQISTQPMKEQQLQSSSQDEFNPFISSRNDILIVEEQDNEIQLFASVPPKHIAYHMSEEEEFKQVPTVQPNRKKPVQPTTTVSKNLTFQQYDQRQQNNKKTKPNNTKPKIVRAEPKSVLVNKYKNFLKTHSRSLDKIFNQIDVKTVEQETISEAQQIEEQFSQQEQVIFKEEVKKQYEKRVVAVQKDMSAEQLVRYYKYLLNNAKRLYFQHKRKK